MSVTVNLTVVLDISSVFVGILYLGGSLAGFYCVIVKPWWLDIPLQWMSGQKYFQGKGVW